MQKISEILKNISFKKNKNSLFIILLIGVMLLLFNKMLLSDGNKNEKSLNKQSCEYEKNEDASEKKLEEILGKIDGTGRVSVMITYDNSKEYVTIADTKSSISDKGGDDKKDVSNERNTVMVKNSSEQTPFIKNEINPKVRGVLVVCDGAKNDKVKLNLKKAVCAALNVELHKVEIMPMKGK
ncbi:MAG: hypothetical protein E7404_06610 [Ruminococcaceae bacterium]|nr:hypothetical protein [Oscillospiraceae bacterium]